LKGFGAEIVYYDPYVNEVMGMQKVDSIEALVQKAEIVCLWHNEIGQSCK
jgi:phosphoglycerate dehydrogenase-like enzyme